MSIFTVLNNTLSKIGAKVLFILSFKKNRTTFLFLKKRRLRRIEKQEFTKVKRTQVTGFFKERKTAKFVSSFKILLK